MVPRARGLGDEPRDVQLIARIRDGDPDALDSLLRLYGPALIRQAAHTTGSIDRAQDVVQDVFFHLWQIRTTLTVNQDIAAYLFWLTRQRARNTLRTDYRASQRDGQWIADKRDGGVARNTAEDDIEAAEIRADLWAALREVPPRCREIFMLVWDRQVPYAEVAKTLGIGVPTVKNQMSRAVKHLIEVLGDRFERRHESPMTPFLPREPSDE